MKAFLAFIFSIFLSLSVFSQQIKLPRDYQYYLKGGEISFEKGLEILRKGAHSAVVSHVDQTVTIKEVVSSLGQPFPYKDFTTLNGDRIEAEDLRGKILVINYWFVGCKPCIAEIPELNQLVAKYQEGEVIFLALANDPADRVASLLTRFPFDYTIIPDEMEFGMNLGIRAYPTHMFVDPEGKIVDLFSGQYEGVGNKISRKIKKLISKWDKK